MNKVKRRLKKLIFLCLVAAFAALIFKGNIYPHQDAVEYLSNFQRTTDIAVTDGFEVFCFDNNPVNLRINFQEVSVYSIGYVDRNSLYLFSHNNETEKYSIYKADYELKESSIIYEFPDSFNRFRLLNSDLLFYMHDGIYFTYQLSTGTTNTVNEDFADKYKEALSRYTVSKKTNVFHRTRKFTVKDSVTGTEKVVFRRRFRNVEPAKHLSDKRSFYLDDIYAVGENVYMIGVTSGCAVIFKYDFETDSVSYYSWIDTSALISKTRDFYFLT